MDDTAEKLKLLEHTILNMSMQISTMQSKLSETTAFKEDYFKTLEGLRNLLSENGIISKEDFDSEIEIFQIFKQLNTEQNYESDLPQSKRKSPIH